ncbi:sugar transferase [Vibrio sp. 1CM2L]|uniref:sugar transferase n=1 Tax=Vibrio sp. 1CM2L TaxID=2929166 RepID=UPI0020C0E59C|nr:sugar transferase [Vibrio sp. 1CM2L]MCK8078706.1 sugar transferase [Vibrio sp. 1CM2L]
MIRVIDFFAALFGLLLLWPVFIVVYLFGYFDTGAPIFRQVRVGRNQKPFTLVKFRSMPLNTKSVATHLVRVSSVTKFGAFIRTTKLDELPQLWNVLKGDMSLVGPRPCLFSQKELIDERVFKGVFDARPGITGLAQINNVDMSTPKTLARLDEKMLENLSLKNYFYFIFRTLSGSGRGDNL